MKPLAQYKSEIAAKYLLALAYQKGKVLNVTKVQKLLYIAYGYFLANEGVQFIHEEPKAWPYGPVFPRTRKWVDYGEVVQIDDPALSEISKDPAVIEVFNKVIDGYADFTASKLSDWSHQEGGPWHKATLKNGFDWNQPIPSDFIREYFSDLTI